MDYINYVKQSPMAGLTGTTGGVGGLGFHHTASGGGSGSFTNGGTRGIFASGMQAASPGEAIAIDYRNISTTGTFSDFGDLQWQRRAGGNCSNSTRACMGGGYDGGGADGSVYQDVIGYITTATTGNAQDFGNLTLKRYALSALSNGTRGCWANGQDGNSNPSVYKDTIDYITIASAGNATDFGDTSYVGRAIWCAANDTRGLIGGGNIETNRIEYITVATTGNASDFGDMTELLYGYNAASASASRAVYTGGRNPGMSNVMAYMTIDTTGNATDFGDMRVARDGHGCCSNGTRQLSGGGEYGTFETDVEYITIANTGNGTDYGDLAVGRWYTAATSGDT